MPGTVRIGQKDPYRRAGSCHKAPSGASTRRGRERPKMTQNQQEPPVPASFGSILANPVPDFPSSPDRANHDGQFHHFAGVVPMLPGIEHDPDPQGRVSAKWLTVFLATDAKRLRGDDAQAKIAAIARPANKTQYDPALQIQGSRMKDDRKSGEPPKNSRQDRLKLALRENLKRRKSQARGRSDPAAASSEDVDASLDDAGEGPGR